MKKKNNKSLITEERETRELKLKVIVAPCLVKISCVQQCGDLAEHGGSSEPQKQKLEFRPAIRNLQDRALVSSFKGLGMGRQKSTQGLPKHS